MLIIPGHLNSSRFFSGVRVALSLLFCVMFVDRCLSFVQLLTWSVLLFTAQESCYSFGIFSRFLKPTKSISSYLYPKSVNVFAIQPQIQGIFIYIFLNMSSIISLQTELFITVLNKSSKELTECRISVKESQDTQNSYPDIYYTCTPVSRQQT